MANETTQKPHDDTPYLVFYMIASPLIRMMIRKKRRKQGR